jgi:HSP20 family protein
MEQMVSWLWDQGREGWLGQAVPSMDLAETDTALEVKLDLPGVAVGDIDIQLHGRTLTISGERHQEQEEKGKTYHRLERRAGSFSRCFTLPYPVEEDEVAAAFHEGVLTITLPKTEDAKTRKISIQE